MNKFLLKISNSHEWILKYSIVLTAVVLIVIALPHETQFNYTYRKGKPWAYESLMAPFDFAINKTESELNEERAQVLRNAHPFYQYDSVIPAQRIDLYKDNLNQAWQNAVGKVKWSERKKEESMKKGVSLLKEVYDKGVIMVSDQAPVHLEDDMFNMIVNKVSEEKSFDDVFNIQTAYDFITTNLSSWPPEDQNFLIPILENSLTHNVIYDEEATQKWSNQLLDHISLSRGMVQKDEVVILKGEVMDDLKFQKLESLKTELRNQEFTGSSRNMMFLGHFILVSLALSMLIVFLKLFRKEIYYDNSRMILLMLLIVMITYMFLWARKINAFDMYLVPVCILPIVVRAFYDTRTALFSHIVTLLIISFEAPGGFEFMFIQTIAGMVAIFSIISMSRRSQFFISVLVIFLAYAVSFIGVTIIHEASFKAIDWMNLRWFLGNSIITLFAFPLIFVFERAFGFMSDVSLMELADSNTVLLRELAFKAPGTFQHSLQVANLAESAIFKVGGNPLLVRVGALYHDIGKTDMPMYFIENQNTQANPHDNISIEESVRIIKSHVIKGIEKSKKRKLPEPIIDFIRTHHGTMRLQYFYHTFLKKFPHEILDEASFRYPGPLPYSKETAVLMMADSVEASSRSLQHADAETIDQLVEHIINNQIEQNQFINSPITLKDISDIKKIFKKMLMSIYHVRMEYPE